jgi:MraZ protein
VNSVTGTYEHSIDAKGRLFIPAKLREELGVTFYLAMGVDACLAIYPQSTWDKFTEKFASLPMSQSAMMRPLFANASKCELDSQGRIVVPQKLRKYANLEKETVIIGVNDRAEIWAADAWRAREEEEMTPEKMRACLEALGF